MLASKIASGLYFRHQPSRAKVSTRASTGFPSLWQAKSEQRAADDAARLLLVAPQAAHPHLLRRCALTVRFRRAAGLLLCVTTRQRSMSYRQLAKTPLFSRIYVNSRSSIRNLTQSTVHERPLSRYSRPVPPLLSRALPLPTPDPIRRLFHCGGLSTRRSAREANWRMGLLVVTTVTRPSWAAFFSVDQGAVCFAGEMGCISDNSAAPLS